MRILVAILLLLFVIEGQVSLTHKHNDGKVHPNCHVCIVKYNPANYEKPEISPKRVNFPVFFIDSRKAFNFTVPVVIRYKDARAPPAV
ncbi:hypothetical protein [Aquifex aeolicus]|uniref:hypothetical protein n=1 Tax=Aquifex aeolicus TaxID=63363 RepID=UPI0002D273A4|nr:hypothetical protein [Aquifex aeolicus]